MFADRYQLGIAFKEGSTGRVISNYPKQHRSNGASKNSNTANNFKPTVRMFKNARERAILRGWLAGEVAPSFFVECLVYNAPNTTFIGSWVSVYREIFNWAVAADKSALEQQSGLVWLFRDSQECWHEANADRFLDALRQVYGRE